MLCTNYTNQPHFKSTIRIVDQRAFITKVNRIYLNEIRYPWTIRESLLCKNAYTKGVYDCGVVGITNLKELFLMHICPTEPVNMDFAKIKDFILQKIAYMRNEHIQGFVLGGKSNVARTKSPKSMEYINNYCDIFTQEGVPFSLFKGGEYWNDVAYFTDRDLWLIGNDRADGLHKIYKDDPLSAIKMIFDEVKICNSDVLSW